MLFGGKILATGAPTNHSLPVDNTARLATHLFSFRRRVYCRWLLPGNEYQRHHISASPRIKPTFA